jgi:hypothetical protein
MTLHQFGSPAEPKAEFRSLRWHCCREEGAPQPRTGTPVQAIPAQQDRCKSRRSDRAVPLPSIQDKPHPHLLYSSVRDEKSVAKTHSLIDELGITVTHIHVGEFRFGGFAASKWNSAGQAFGDDGCSFLFSLTHDAIITSKGPGPDRRAFLGSPDVIALATRRF